MYLKGALSDFCQTMLIFESAKTNTSIPQQNLPLFWYLHPTCTYTQLWHNDHHGNKRRWHTSIFKQKPTQISCVKQFKINATHLSKKIKCNLDIRFEPFLLLEFSPPWESCFDIYAGPTSGLIVTLLFYVLFLYFPLFYFPVLYIYIRSAIIRLVHSNWALSPRYNYKTHPLTADWLQVCFGTWSNTAVKSIFKKLLSAPLKHQLIDGFEIIKE